jgi:hypothetical protein
MLVVIARSEATKQSTLSLRGKMDCFAEPVIGRRFAPTRWLAMTCEGAARSRSCVGNDSLFENQNSADIVRESGRSSIPEQLR